VVDQPAFLAGHWASSTGLFLRRFGSCIRDFIGAEKIEGERVCEPAWGESPSAEMRLPDELTHPRTASHISAAVAGGSVPASPLSGGTNGRQSWYGFYP